MAATPASGYTALTLLERVSCPRNSTNLHQTSKIALFAATTNMDLTSGGDNCMAWQQLQALGLDSAEYFHQKDHTCHWLLLLFMLLNLLLDIGAGSNLQDNLAAMSVHLRVMRQNRS